MLKFSSILVVALSVATPAYAGEQCKQDIAKIDAAMDEGKVAPDQKQEVIDLREQAVQLCGAGNDDAGLDVIAQAKQILNID